MKIKVAEATNEQINYLVAQLEDVEVYIVDTEVCLPDHDDELTYPKRYNPCEDWAQGGPITEQEKMTVGKQVHKTEWTAESFNGEGINIAHIGYGPTPLIAAMRVYVASQLGEEAEVPDELI